MILFSRPRYRCRLWCRPRTEAELKMVKALIRMSLRTRTLSVERDVQVVSQVNAMAQSGIETKPQSVRLTLEVPASWNTSSPELEEITVTTILPTNYAVDTELPVEVLAPRNVKVRKITPAKVVVIEP